MNIITHIAADLSVKESQVKAAIKLLDEGATVPFIARYRKEATGGLDDSQLRLLEQRLAYLRELEERRQTILSSIREQGKLSPELEQAILAVDNKAQLEDLYLPYKPKRRTKAQIAKEAGLEPLAMQLLVDPSLDPNTFAVQFINTEHNITDIKTALDGAQQILMEYFSEEAQLVGELRERLWQEALLTSRVIEDKKAEGSKFADYFSYQEAIKQVPSHRALAIFRGQKLGILRVSLELADSQLQQNYEAMIAKHFKISHEQKPAITWLHDTITRTWRIKLWIRLELDLLSRLREKAETEAIHVFAKNLKDLLMAAPAGAKTTMGLDPGLRTGVKVAVVDATGKLLDYTAIYPHAPQHKWQESLTILKKLCDKHKVALISIGNGTASRETDKLATELIKSSPELALTKIIVSEAGASVYSASAIAAQEFPDLDVSFRGAVSIARRLQDPLAELVKIEPKSIGVGQYQHDVSQTQLAQSLTAVVEDCVNAVGVDLNTASVPLLSRVSGLNETIAQNIVQFRNQQGAFSHRNDLKKVARLGDKTFEQAAGFLRIMNGSNPLDASAVHPEAYPVIEKILTKQNKKIKGIIGNTTFLQSLKASDYTDENFGIPTVIDIIKELEKPGRDPRPEFITANFQDGIETLTDLKPGMILEGVITNVTNFGAFVDIGVHQDGLVHKSMMADYYIKDPRDIVKVGSIVKVKVLEIDLERKRASLSMRLNENSQEKKLPNKEFKQKNYNAKVAKKSDISQSAMSFALTKALKS